MAGEFRIYLKVVSSVFAFLLLRFSHQVRNKSIITLKTTPKKIIPTIIASPPPMTFGVLNSKLITMAANMNERGRTADFDHDFGRYAMFVRY